MPPQTTRPPFLTASSAAGTSAPTGAKMIAASSGSGGGSSEPPAQTAPSDRAKFAPPCPRAREGVDVAALPDGDLRHDVRGGAESVEAERAPSPAIRSCASRSDRRTGAAQLRHRRALRQRKAIARVGDSVRRRSRRRACSR